MDPIENKDIERSAVAGSFTLNAQLANGKSLSFSGYVLQGEDVAAINQKLDVACEVVERQRLAAEIPLLEKKIEDLESGKRQVEAIVADISGKEKASSQEKQTLNTMRVNLRKIEEDISAGLRAVHEAKLRSQRAA